MVEVKEAIRPAGFPRTLLVSHWLGRGKNWRHLLTLCFTFWSLSLYPQDSLRSPSLFLLIYLLLTLPSLSIFTSLHHLRSSLSITSSYFPHYPCFSLSISSSHSLPYPPSLFLLIHLFTLPPLFLFLLVRLLFSSLHHVLPSSPVPPS